MTIDYSVVRVMQAERERSTPVRVASADRKSLETRKRVALRPAPAR